MPCRYANATRCGRWLVTANTSSCSGAVMSRDLAPVARHQPRHPCDRVCVGRRLRASGSLRRPRNRVGVAASGPLLLAPGDRVAGHEPTAGCHRARAPRRARRPSRCPASNTTSADDPRASHPAPGCDRGTASSTASAIATAAPRSGTTPSISPRCERRRRCRRVGLDPAPRETPAWRAASANDPPISPVPTTTRRISRARAASASRKRSFSAGSPTVTRRWSAGRTRRSAARSRLRAGAPRRRAPRSGDSKQTKLPTEGMYASAEPFEPAGQRAEPVVQLAALRTNSVSPSAAVARTRGPVR